jgi:hypothetical protein
MAVVTQVSAESIVGGLVKPKRVKKAIVKLENSDNSLKMLEKGLKIQKSPKKTVINENCHPNIAIAASTIPENVAIKVKISKPRSKKAEKGPIVEQNAPTIPNTGPILETTAPINGINDAIVVDNSHADVFVDCTIPNAAIVEEALTKVLKKAVGRPLGCLDKVKRQAKGENKLGRPLGAKDLAPRQKRQFSGGEQG